MTKIGTASCILALIFMRGSPPLPGLPSSETAAPPAHGPAVTLLKILNDAEGLRQDGNYKKALDLFLAGYEQAQRQQQTRLAAQFLLRIGNCHFARHHYQDAIRAYLAAREVFADLGDRASVTSLNGNLSSLYLQLGEFDAAHEAVKRALAQDTAADTNGRRARLLALRGSVLIRLGDRDEAQQLFHEAIGEAARFNDPELLSNIWDRLGSEHFSRKRLSEAEAALLEGFRIRKLNRLPGLAGSYRNLGMLRMEQGDLRSASALLNAAVEESKSSRQRIPEWGFTHARGRLWLSQGKIEQAHSDFRLALELARGYRLRAPSSDATRVSLEAVLQAAYASFIETGAQLSWKSRRPDLARETFQALEESRAGSLAVRVRERGQLQRTMPRLYWETLAELESAQGLALVDESEELRATVRRLRSDVAEMEVRAGGGRFSGQPDLLSGVQRSLGSDAVLVSFHLGKEHSWMWAASRSDLTLYRLPDRATIIALAGKLRTAVARREAPSEALGRQLYQTLFGRLDRHYRSKSQWLLSLDEGMFETPFAALVAGGKQGSPLYLIERHSIRTISSAANLARSPKPRRIAGAFAGVGDAVYNAADNRWQGRTAARPVGWLGSHWAWTVSAAEPSNLGLSRLPGSGPEIERCAREWRNGSVLLKGRDVTRENVRRLMGTGPSVMHFATHILQDRGRSSDALIALSISDKAQDELLGPSEISGWNLEGGLVVLSGCSSGVAIARPGAGLMGMTRSWLTAGAGAVVATGWSTPDDSGVFFQRFYRELQRSEAPDPAHALQAAQIETLRSGDWRSHPGYWSAYFVLGNY